MHVRVTMTAEELIDRGLWDWYCELTDTNVWAVNEGRMDQDTELVLPDVIAAQVLARVRREDTDE